MKRVTVLVCNQGLGHLRRVTGLLDELDRTHPGLIEADIYVDREKLKNFSPMPQRRFHDLKADVDHYEQELLDRYPGALAECDYVWSDNLVFPLKHRREVFLTGSFLWPEEAKLFEETQPLVIGNRYFATPLLRSSAGYTGVGMYDFAGNGRPCSPGSRILLSCGRTDAARAMMTEALPALREWIRDLPGDTEVYVEPDFLEDLNDGVHVRKATFDPQMYDGISAAVIRPGMGTVSECLTRGIRIFAFWEGGQFEMEHNVRVLKELGQGEGHGSVEAAARAASGFLSQINSQGPRRSDRIDFDGVRQTCDKIREILC